LCICESYYLLFFSLIYPFQNKNSASNPNKKPISKSEQMQFILEGFPSIGPVKAKQMIEQFKTLKNIVNASEGDLEKVLGKNTKEIYNLALIRMGFRKVKNFLDENKEHRLLTSLEKIEKNFDSTMKFKGLGRSLWEVGLRQIQQIADERGVAIIHTVLKHPRIDLTGEKWDEIFLPILKKHGYTKINTPGYDKGSEPKRWRKKYDPNEQKMAGS